MKKITLIAIMVIIFFSCNQQTVDTKTEGEKLMNVSREWSKVAATRDVEKTLNYWADDATVISAGQPTLIGKKAIRQMVEGSFKNPSFKIGWEPESVEISKSGDVGYMIEHDDLTVNDSTGNPKTQHYKSITIWKKQADGSWKNVVDVMSPESSK
jgi:uncharacterized protein (TIGR02246 family)